MFYHPEVYGILPHRHRYTQNGAEVLTSFFIPCTKIPKDRKRFLSHRGFVDPDAVVEWQMRFVPPWLLILRHSLITVQSIRSMIQRLFLQEFRINSTGQLLPNSSHASVQCMNVRLLILAPYVSSIRIQSVRLIEPMFRALYGMLAKMARSRF